MQHPEPPDGQFPQASHDLNSDSDWSGQVSATPHVGSAGEVQATEAPHKKKVGAAKAVLFWWLALFAGKSMWVSILAHVFFLGGATAWYVATETTSRKVTFTAGTPGPTPSQRALEHKVSMGKKSKSMSAPAQARRITTSGMAKVALPEMPAMPMATEIVPNRMSGLGGVGFGFGVGGGGGGMGGGGGGGGISMFGLRARARSAVFVLDISGSMVGEAGKSVTTYAVLEKEAIKVIQSLDPGLAFGMVVFSREAEAFKETVVPATTQNKNAAIAWYRANTPAAWVDPNMPAGRRDKHRGTRADLGLERAFAMKPDVIFFVSDGEPSGSSGREVLDMVKEKQAASGKFCVINSIAFMADNGQRFMEELAKQNRGTYKEVNPKIPASTR